MGSKEDANETTDGIELKSASMITALSKEADQIILEAGKAARREAEQEAERFLKEYKQKTKQIVLKIREETKAKASHIANKMRDGIIQNIEKAMDDILAESSRKVEGLVKITQQMANEEVGQATAEVKVKAKGELAAQEETAAENERKTEPEIKEGGIELQEPSEGFNRWLAQ